MSLWRMNPFENWINQTARREMENFRPGRNTKPSQRKLSKSRTSAPTSNEDTQMMAPRWSSLQGMQGFPSLMDQYWPQHDWYASPAVWDRQDYLRPSTDCLSNHDVSTSTNSKGDLTMKISLPEGLKQEDVHLDFEDGGLALTASRSHNEEKKLRKGYSRHSSNYSVSHYWPLGEEIKAEDIEANFDEENGRLEIVIAQHNKDAAKSNRRPIVIGKGRPLNTMDESKPSESIQIDSTDESHKKSDKDYHMKKEDKKEHEASKKTEKEDKKKMKYAMDNDNMKQDAKETKSIDDSSSPGVYRDATSGAQTSEKSDQLRTGNVQGGTGWTTGVNQMTGPATQGSVRSYTTFRRTPYQITTPEAFLSTVRPRSYADWPREAKKTVDNATENVKDWAADTKDSAKDSAKQWTETAKEWAVDAKDAAKDTAKDTAKTTKDAMDSASKTAKDAANTAKEWVQDKAADASDVAKDAAKESKQYREGAQHGASRTAQEWAADTKESTQKNYKDVKDTVNRAASDAKDYAESSVESAKSAAKSYTGASNTSDVARNTAKVTADDMKDSAKQAGETWTDEAKGAAQTAKDTAMEYGASAKETAKEAWGSVSDGDKLEAAKDTAMEYASSAKDAAMGIGAAAADTAKQAFQYAKETVLGSKEDKDAPKNFYGQTTSKSQQNVKDAGKDAKQAAKDPANDAQKKVKETQQNLKDAMKKKTDDKPWKEPQVPGIDEM